MRTERVVRSIHPLIKGNCPSSFFMLYNPLSHEVTIATVKPMTNSILKAPLSFALSDNNTKGVNEKIPLYMHGSDRIYHFSVNYAHVLHDNLIKCKATLDENLRWLCFPFTEFFNLTENSILFIKMSN